MAKHQLISGRLVSREVLNHSQGTENLRITVQIDVPCHDDSVWSRPSEVFHLSGRYTPTDCNKSLTKTSKTAMFALYMIHNKSCVLENVIFW